MNNIKIFFCLMIIATFTFVISCDHDNDNKSNKSFTNGSCTSADQTGSDSITMCGEMAEPYENFKFECEYFGGSWSSSSCDQSLYSRKCTQEIEISVDDEEPATYTEILYFETGSSIYCLGEEEQL